MIISFGLNDLFFQFLLFGFNRNIYRLNVGEQNCTFDYEKNCRNPWCNRRGKRSTAFSLTVKGFIFCYSLAIVQLNHIKQSILNLVRVYKDIIITPLAMSNVKTDKILSLENHGYMLVSIYNTN